MSEVAAGYKAVAKLYNALMTGVVLTLVSQRGNAPARMHFHPALPAQDFSDRKALAGACHDYILGGISRLLAPVLAGQEEDQADGSAWDPSALGHATGY